MKKSYMVCAIICAICTIIDVGFSVWAGIKGAWASMLLYILFGVWSLIGALGNWVLYDDEKVIEEKQKQRQEQHENIRKQTEELIEEYKKLTDEYKKLIDDLNDKA